MQTKKYSKGQDIFKSGEKVSEFALIMDGDVLGNSPGHSFTLGRTDIAGLSALKSGVYTYTYTALTDVTACLYPCTGFDDLDSFIRENADIAFLMVMSMCRHTDNLLNYRLRLKSETERLPALSKSLFEEYERLCKLYGAAGAQPPAIPDFKDMPGCDDFPQRRNDFHNEINKFQPDIRRKFFYANPGITAVFLSACCDDITHIYNICNLYNEYLKNVSGQLFSADGSCLYSMIVKLLSDTSATEGADFAVNALMSSLTEDLTKLSDLSLIDADSYRSMLQGDSSAAAPAAEEPAAAPATAAPAAAAPAAEEVAAVVEVAAADIEDIEDIPATPGVTVSGGDDNAPLNPKLKNSLDEIIAYADADKEVCAVFKSCVREYAELPDRNSPDDDVYDLRRDLVKSFYVIYRSALRRSFEDKSPPTAVNMFLNFGYVDADLAGHGNANFLCEIADSFKGNPEKNIFTMREWLHSIYKGERDPSLSEFDMDYTAYLRDMKNNKQITPEEEKKMLADQDAKLNYELDNAFPVVNRVTFGNPSKFCPVFGSHNVVRNLKDALVTPAAVGDIIEEVRSIDFSAFYRETSYSDSKVVGGINEHINVEILPNIILTPTIGIRGSMWQDIEGRIRTTPARMFMPTFLENDLKQLVLKLVAEFRWEICRRIQGTRWNDMTDPSLTSYFCDYLQFYMNNKNISMQTMTEIRNEISAARNNYKTVFVQNYANWVLNESRGMARLNNVALGILMTFCPFSVEIRKKLELNMRFREALNRYNVRQQKKVTHFVNLTKKLQQNGKPVPPEIKQELEFWYK